MKTPPLQPRYLRCHFGSVSLGQIAAFEQRLGVVLPKEYREFLLRENGGIPNQEGDDEFKVIFGIYDGANDLAFNWEEARDDLPDRVLPIGENLNQEYILLDLADGSVHMEGQRIADRFDQFVLANFVPFVGTDSPAELIKDHRLGELEELLDAGEIDIDAEAKFGMTLFQYSAWLGKDDVVESLA